MAVLGVNSPVSIVRFSISGSADGGVRQRTTKGRSSAGPRRSGPPTPVCVLPAAEAAGSGTECRRFPAAADIRLRHAQAARGQGGGAQAAAASPRPQACAEVPERSRRRRMAPSPGARGRVPPANAPPTTNTTLSRAARGGPELSGIFTVARSHPLGNGSCATPQRSFSPGRPLHNGEGTLSLRKRPPSWTGDPMRRDDARAGRVVTSKP
jgi:hypothetical protein